MSTLTPFGYQRPAIVVSRDREAVSSRTDCGPLGTGRMACPAAAGTRLLIDGRPEPRIDETRVRLIGPGWLAALVFTRLFRHTATGRW